LEENEAGVWHGKPPKDYSEVHNKQKWHLIANDIYTVTNLRDKSEQ